ncbi:MAG: histidine--tRNA ligase [Planctomycetota bacterium]
MANEAEAHRAPRGVEDVLPEAIPRWERLERTAATLARLRGFREIRPALLEHTSLFTRSIGEVTDIVEKEMFTIERGGSSYTLRPEGTAGIVRAYLQAGYAKTAPVQRLFHIGPMFRYERPQKGRERMFTQFDVEALGSTDPRLDAEVIHLAALFFEELGVAGLEVRVNSMGDGEDRDRWREAVREFLRPAMNERCALCRERFGRNVLRVLDCKEPRCKARNAGAPAILDFLADANALHFRTVIALLEDLGRTVVVDPGIVRGFDYYTRTVFELHYPRLGARSALCGGGRYDHLIRDIGGPDLGAVGFAIGFTGTLLVLDELGLAGADRAEPPPAFVVTASEDLAAPGFLLAEELRRAGIGAVYDVDGRTLKNQMKVANRGGHRFAVILGAREVEGGIVQLKDMVEGEQTEVPRARVVEEIRRRLGPGEVH